MNRFAKLALLPLALLLLMGQSKNPVQTQQTLPLPPSEAAKGAYSPLDALSASEIADTVAILKASGQADNDTAFPSITLQPAAKDFLRAWHPGLPFSRYAAVTLRRSGMTYEAVVDVTSHKVLSYTAMPNVQPAIMGFESDIVTKALFDDRRFQLALARRRIDAKDVICITYSMGNFPGEDAKGARLAKLTCGQNKDMPGPGSPREIEGLLALANLDQGSILDVMDKEEVALPAMPQGWGTTLPAKGQLMKPVAITTPNGSNISMQGATDVTWANWAMHLRADKRAGLILNQVRIKDGDRWRDIAFQMNLSEIFVPYMDPESLWYWRTFLDVGEFGFGASITSLRPGVDCPEASWFLPMVLPDDKGGSITTQNAICIFERPTGDPAYRHYDDDTKKISGVPQVEMVIRHVATLTNYDYIIDYVFTPQGEIKIRAGATGFDATKSVTEKSQTEFPGTAKSYGSLIAPYTVAPNHDHYFSFRLDLDVDGTQNQLERVSVIPSPASNSPRTSVWTLKSQHYTAEGPVAVNHDSAGEFWRVINPNVTTTLGNHPGYAIDMGHATTSALAPDDSPQQRAGFTAYNLWATQYAPSEQWAAGAYPNQAGKGQGLPAYVSQKRSIDNEDLVLWATMGFRHIPQPEDFPILPTVWHEITLHPSFFFDKDPGLTFNPGAISAPKQQ